MVDTKEEAYSLAKDIKMSMVTKNRFKIMNFLLNKPFRSSQNH